MSAEKRRPFVAALFGIWASVFAMSLIASAGGCAGTTRTQESGTDMKIADTQAVNSAEGMNRPYVVMVSIDGYRYDYNSLFNPPNLTRLAADGVAAESMRPVYPSKTFPNHYSIVTGLYADKHGIVSNEFYDPAREQTYALADRAAVEDGSWYGGDPLWIAVQKQGVLAASYFWVGSESNIQGRYPNYYFRYDESVPNNARVDQVIDWLKMPADRRPHLITMYFDDVDTAAHEFGVQSQQTREAVLDVDAAIGRLRAGIAQLNLPVNVIVVSDHGMQDIDPSKVLLIDEAPEVARLLPKFRAVGRGPQMNLYLNKGESPKLISDLQAALRKKSKFYRVYRREEMAALNYGALPRCGDLVIVPDLPYLVGTKAKAPGTAGANHGWDPARAKNMHGIFFAAGPNLREHMTVPSFENVHVYPLVLEILGLRPISQIDGRLEVLQGALKR